MANCNIHHPQQACTLVIFGVSGDLSARRLMPSIFSLHCLGLLPEGFSCFGCSRREWSRAELLSFVKDSLATYVQSPYKERLESEWETFSKKIHFCQVRFDEESDYRALKERLASHDRGCDNTVYYLSTSPSFFTPICSKLSHVGLLKHQNPPCPWNRIVIEKPFGRDLASAKQLQSSLETIVNESQIFRIDHWLGKETIQNLMVWRFSNHIFESLWNRTHIDHVQISVAEELGIGRRGAFFEESGILRDMIQNHMMQLLSIVAMEPPVIMEPYAIRHEKLKVFQAIRPIASSDVDLLSVRGQYSRSGDIPGYLEEEGVSPSSNVETFAAVKLHVDNWRWYDVPFYLRVGKRMRKRCTQVAIVFKKEPSVLFKQLSGTSGSNTLIMRIQPDEGISLRMNCKQPQLKRTIGPVSMDFSFQETFGHSGPQAYERLLCDSLLGDPSLFAHCDEVLASWNIVEPILNRWSDTSAPKIQAYAAGSWGPEASLDLLARDGRRWID